MKQPVFFLALWILSRALPVSAQVSTISSDKDWKSQSATIKNAYEAELIIRVGDVDNLGFGWPEDFDPFCGRMTQAHYYPWDINPGDLPGFDRILASSKYKPTAYHACMIDGYMESFDPLKCKPTGWQVPTTAAKDLPVQNAWLQLFIDDFQAPSMCSNFSFTLNGKRFVEGERMLNAIDQTGPVGKLISIPLTEDLYPLITSGQPLQIFIDETKGAGDGFAVDFIRLLVNRIRENSCKGNIKGRVLVKGSDMPVVNAKVTTADNASTQTDADGHFELRDIPTGFEVLLASAPGYIDGFGTGDVSPDDNFDEVIIYLEKGATAKFDNKVIKVGESVTLNNILFDQGKATLRSESITELDKLVTFLKANAGAEIELSGHTSSEGERNFNRSLSYQRVKACKDYIVSKGIDEGRIIAVGYGPDQPVAPNDTEANRSKNRRVEMRITKL